MNLGNASKSSGSFAVSISFTTVTVGLVPLATGFTTLPGSCLPVETRESAGGAGSPELGPGGTESCGTTTERALAAEQGSTGASEVNSGQMGKPFGGSSKLFLETS